jgi:hypothetical protein
MRIEKTISSVVLMIMILSLLTACNLGKAAPTPTPIPPTETPTPTSTMTPFPTPVPTSTTTLMSFDLPTSTVTLFYEPTATATSKWSGCPGIVITLNDTLKGDILHIQRCEDGLEYDLGPIEKGFYAVGPNDKFLIYVTLSGHVYGARIGSVYLKELYNLGREHEFTALNRKVTPNFDVSFTGDGPIYRLVLYERNYGQKRMYELPIGITQ